MMNRIEKIANEMNLDYLNNTASGKYQGYRFTLLKIGNNFNNQYVQKVLVFPLDELTEYQLNNLNQYFRTVKKEINMYRCGYSEHKFTFQIMETFKQIDTVKFTKILEIIVEAFKKYDVKTFSKCIFCKEEEPDTETRVYKIMSPAHQECVEKVKIASQEKKENYDNSSTKYPEGITGAVIGALLGIIPWVIIEIFTGFYAAILAVLVGYSSFFFYKKFGGKVTGATKYIITIVTFLAILLSNVIVCAYIIVSWEGALILDNFILLYQDPEVGGYLLESLGISVLIGGIGLFSVFKKVKSEEFTTAVE